MKLKCVLVVGMLVAASVALAVEPGPGWKNPRPRTPAPAGEKPGPVDRESLSDPIGDTFGSLSPQHDITEFRVERSGGNMVVTLTFNGTIAPGDPPVTASLVGYVEFDADQDPNTGFAGTADGFCPTTSGLGIDFFLDLFSYDAATGTSPLYDENGSLVSDVATIFTSNSVMLTFPYASMGSANGVVDAVTVIGTVPEPTDCAPDGGYLTVPVELQSFSID